MPLAFAAVLSWRRKDLTTLTCLVLCCFCVGFWRGSVAAGQFDVYSRLALRKVVVVVRASDDGVYDDHSQLTFPADHARIRMPFTTTLPGQLKISGFGVSSVNRGDSVQATGKLYPTRGNSSASISFADLQVVAHGSSPIDELRHRFAAGVQSALPEPQASFGLGLLIGQRNTLPADTSTVLLAAGLTHLIAVSGYNVTILVNAARRLLGKRSKFQTAATCGLLVATFITLTGFSPSVVRAAIVSGLGLLAWYYGRIVHPVVLLLVAAAITVYINPNYVWGNVSWYLSFLAFSGVLILAPLVTRRIYSNKRPNVLAQIIIESVCAEAMTLPYLLHTFGQMSLVALPANALVAACVPLAMLLSTVAGLAGWLVPSVAGWFAWPAKLLLSYMLSVASLLAGLPHVFIEHITFSTVDILMAYLFVFWVIYFMSAKLPKRGILTDKNQVTKEEATGNERALQMVDH